MQLRNRLFVRFPNGRLELCARKFTNLLKPVLLVPRKQGYMSFAYALFSGLKKKKRKEKKRKEKKRKKERNRPLQPFLPSSWNPMDQISLGYLSTDMIILV